MSDFPYSYISVEGNIGTGKTSLCNKLADSHNCTLLLEEFAENPFLPYFYDNPERYAFPLELFFMTERFKQMEQHFSKQDLFSDYILSDYMFLKTLLFANINLRESDFKIFERLFRTLDNTLPKPDIILYLHRDLDRLLYQIKKRGRSYELSISADYLQKIQDAYFHYFRNETDIPVVILNLGDLDFLQSRELYEEIERILRRHHTPGLHHVSLLSV